MNDVRKDIKKLADTIGKQEVVKQLVLEKVSYRVAEQLSAGTYKSEPKSLRDKLQNVLKKNGFATEGKAS